MKKGLVLVLIFYCLTNLSFAQHKKKPAFANQIFFVKADIGNLIPFNISSPSLLKSDKYSYAFSIGYINRVNRNGIFYLGFEIDYSNPSLINNDKTLGIGGQYNFRIYDSKILFHYKICKWINLQYNIGFSTINCTRPDLILPANLSSNGKLIEEYPIKSGNMCFIAGIDLNLNITKWLTINSNIEYYGVKLNFKDVVHAEDNYVTNVYSPDLKLRSYIISVGLMFHTLSF